MKILVYSTPIGDFHSKLFKTQVELQTTGKYWTLTCNGIIINVISMIYKSEVHGKMLSIYFATAIIKNLPAN